MAPGADNKVEHPTADSPRADRFERGEGDRAYARGGAEIAATSYLVEDPSIDESPSPVSLLLSRVVHDHRALLRDELPRLEQMARKVVAVHGAKEPERLLGVLQCVCELRGEFDGHLRGMEREILPAVQSGGRPGQEALGQLRQALGRMEERVVRLCSLTTGFSVPAGACATWTALWSSLGTFVPTVRRHLEAGKELARAWERA